jgi:hypothetical protein
MSSPTVAQNSWSFVLEQVSDGGRHLGEVVGADPQIVDAHLP